MALKPKKGETVMPKTYTNREIDDAIVALCDKSISAALGPIAEIFGLDLVMLCVKKLLDDFPYEQPPKELTEMEKDMLASIEACDGMEVEKSYWPVAEALARAGHITLGSPRGPHRAFRRAELVE